MTEKNEKDFETIKQEMLEKFPAYKDGIQLCSDIDDLNEVYKMIEQDAKPEPDKTFKVIHEHKFDKGVEHLIGDNEEEDNEDDESSASPYTGGSNLSKTGGSVPLEGWDVDKQGKLVPPNLRALSLEKRKFETAEQLLDTLFTIEMAGKIESTRAKPNKRIIENGNKATKMIEKLWSIAMENKSGREYLTRAGKDLQTGRVGPFTEPDWLRNMLNPEGRKNAKKKPFLRSN